jgi:hypothetical protein
MIQDIIQYVDEENEEGAIGFLYQQKLSIELNGEWVDFVLKYFNFGKQFRWWIQMSAKSATASIKTNGFVLKLFLHISFM